MGKCFRKFAYLLPLVLITSIAFAEVTPYAVRSKILAELGAGSRLSDWEELHATRIIMEFEAEHLTFYEAVDAVESALEGVTATHHATIRVHVADNDTARISYDRFGGDIYLANSPRYIRERHTSPSVPTPSTSRPSTSSSSYSIGNVRCESRSGDGTSSVACYRNNRKISETRCESYETASGSGVRCYQDGVKVSDTYCHWVGDEIVCTQD